MINIIYSTLIQKRFTKALMLGLVSLFSVNALQAQVKIGTNPDQIQRASILELESDTKGLLLPRLSDTLAINALNPLDGMLIYLEKGPLKGLYVRKGGVWNFLSGVSSTNTNVDESKLNLQNIGGKLNPLTQIAAGAGTTTGQVLSWNGTSWVSANVTAATAGTVTTAAQPAITSVGTLSGLTVTAPIAGSVTGNAGTATALSTSRTINGVAFDGTSNITVTAVVDAATLTGTTLAANVVGSSLTSVGTLGNLTVTNPIAGSITGNAATATSATSATTAGTVTTAAQPAITSVGTLSGLTVTAPITGAITGNAATATKLAAPKNINGVAFDGSSDITISAAADAATLTGTTLNPAIVNSSLTSVGTLGNLTVTNPIAGSITGNAATATTATSATTAGTVTTAAQPAITSVGTLSGLTVTAPIAGSVTGSATTVTAAAQPAITSVGTLTGLTVTAPITGSVTGNAGTATALATSRTINGVAFDGTSNITVTAVVDAATLTGTTLAANVVGSSLTSVGTLGNLTVTNPIAGSITGNAATATSATSATTAGTVTTAAQPAITSVGTLTGLTVTAPIAGSVTGNAATATKLSAPKSINGVAFDGSSDITISAAADAATLTGTTLNPAIVNSSLTSVGTLGNLTVTNPIAGSITGNAATATKLAAPKNINGVAFDGSSDITISAAANAATLTGTTLNPAIVNSSLTSVGTLANLTVTNPIVGSITGNAATVTTNANLTGEVTSVGNAATVPNATVMGKVLIGYISAAGTVTATDNILQAIQKLDGNKATNANLTGMVTSVGNAASLGTFSSANLSGAVTDETGTGTVVFATSPTLVTPVLGLASATSVNKLTLTAPLTAATLTLADGSTLATAGAFSQTLTATAATNVTLPTTGTLATLTGTETLTNKTLTSPTLTGTPIAPTAAALTSTTQIATTEFVTVAVTTATPDATASVKGKVQLAGDLAGTGSTAAAPVITNVAVTTEKIANDAVTTAKIANDAVTTAKITNDAVTTSKIVNNAVTTDKILNDNVTDVKILSVSGTKITGNISGNAANVTGTIAIANGGTGATTVSVAKTNLGLGNVDNTSDANKPVSTATQTALDLKANLASPTFTGTVTAPAFAGALTGNASTATALATPRTINGVSFNGTADITVADATKISIAERAVANGVATLDAGGKVLASQLPVGSQTFKGTWDASTNTPTLADGTGTAGWTYRVAVASTRNLGSGPTVFAIGDDVIYNGLIWQLSPSSSSVSSVNGQQGAVVLTKSDVGLGLVDNTSDLVKNVLSATKLAAARTINGTVFDGTANITVADATKIPISEKGIINGVATLDGTGKIPSNQLPALAISNTFVINSQAEMLALVSTVGDIAIRTDISKSLILTTGPATILANWQELLVGTNTVQSVNGQTGIIALTTSNITEGSNLYYTDARVAGKEPAITAGTTSQYFRGDKTFQNLNKTAVGLANVDNTADADKPISTLAQNAINLKANIASPTLTGTPLAPTAIAGTTTTQIATTEFVSLAITAVTTPDATTSVKGKILLAGDLAGTGSTASAPVITNNAVTTAKIAESNVTYAKIQNVSATDKVLGRVTAGSGVVEEISTTGSGNVVRATAPTLVNPALGTPSSGVATNLTGTAASLTAGNVTTNANLTGEVTSVGNAATVPNATVMGKVLTGYISAAGTVTATDNILQAIQKLDGNKATNANLTGMVTSVGNAASLGTFSSANLSGAVTNETGTGVVVFATSPTLVTPVLGVASATSVNKLTLTAPASNATLTLAEGSTLATAGAFSQTLTATAATDVTLPTTGTLATLTGAETLTNKTLVAPVLGAATGTSLSVTGSLTSTVATGTAPFIVSSTTPVANLSIGGNAATATTVTTNANLTGPITSSGNGTAVAAQTGIGSIFVMNSSPTLVTPILGVASATSVNKLTLTAPANTATLTLADGSTLATAGAFATTLTTTGATGVTLPTTGTLYGTATGSITSAQLATSLTDETGTLNAVFAESPTFTGIPLAPTAAVGTNTTQLATTAFVLANSDSYSSVDAATEISTTSSTDVVASGMTLTPGAGTYSVMFNGQYVSSSAGTTARGVTDLTAAYSQLIATTTTNSSHAAAFGSGETLTAGVYAIASAGSIAGTLNLSGSASDVFIFKINGALAVGAGVTVNLIDGAQASNVFWVATSAGAMTIGATTIMKGTLFAKDAAASIGSGSTLEGRLFTNAGAITIGPSTISTPTGSSPINLGELSSFALFTSSGGLGNAGTSTIIGNIGTNEGAVTGFDSPTVVNGSIFTPTGAGEALATFSIYQNGVLVANSSRTRTVNTVDISLQAIATVTAGQTIDIRWKTSLGILKLQNRILTLIKVR